MKLSELLQENELTIDSFIQLVQNHTAKNRNYGDTTSVFTHANGIINVEGDVFIPTKIKLVDGHLPFKFGKVTGTFILPYTKELTSFQNCPDVVGKKFIAQIVGVTSFEHAPKIIGNGGYGHGLILSCDNLTSFEGIAEHIQEINGEISFDGNTITSGGLGLLHIKGLEFVRAVPIQDKFPPFDIINKYLKRKDDVFECQAELIEKGYEEYAKL